MVTLYLLFQPSLTRVSEGCLPGASSCASAVTHGQHRCVCGNSESRPVVVGLEHGKARRGIIGIGCWENKQSLTLESNQVILCSNAMDCFKPPSRTTALNPPPKEKVTYQLCQAYKFTGIAPTEAILSSTYSCKVLLRKRHIYSNYLLIQAILSYSINGKRWAPYLSYPSLSSKAPLSVTYMGSNNLAALDNKQSESHIPALECHHRLSSLP